MVSCNCITFCPEVPAIYHCVITNTGPQWTVSGSGVSGYVSFASNAAIEYNLPFGRSFTAIKTGSNSFRLKFIANIEFITIV